MKAIQAWTIVVEVYFGRAILNVSLSPDFDLFFSTYEGAAENAARINRSVLLTSHRIYCHLISQVHTRGFWMTDIEQIKAVAAPIPLVASEKPGDVP